MNLLRLLQIPCRMIEENFFRLKYDWGDSRGVLISMWQPSTQPMLLRGPFPQLLARNPALHRYLSSAFRPLYDFPTHRIQECEEPVHAGLYRRFGDVEAVGQ